MVFHFKQIEWIVYEKVLTKHFNLEPHDDYKIQKGDIIVFEDRHYEVMEKPYYNTQFKIARIEVARLVTMQIKV